MLGQWKEVAFPLFLVENSTLLFEVTSIHIPYHSVEVNISNYQSLNPRKSIFATDDPLKILLS
jgi:hypothetical protein